MMGHLIAAAGAVELITCVMAIQHGMLHADPQSHPDPDLDLDYVWQSRPAKVDSACPTTPASVGRMTR